MDYVEEVAEKASQAAHDVRDRAAGLAGDIADAARERPYTAIAIAAGLAFAVGALWKISHRQPASPWQSMLARLPDLPAREDILPRRWR